MKLYGILPASVSHWPWKNIRDKQGLSIGNIETSIDLTERSGWIVRIQDAENNQMEGIMANTIGASVRTTFKNHIIKFNKKLYVQDQSEAIGAGLVGNVADIFMIWWGRERKQSLEEQPITLLF